MKAGTAQKMTLNMLSTSVMIKLGHVIDNKLQNDHIIEIQLLTDAVLDVLQVQSIDFWVIYFLVKHVISSLELNHQFL